MRGVPQHEGLIVEFKSDVKRLADNDLVEAVVGMANTKGGSLYLGVEDDGEITGIHKDHSNDIGVSALIANKTVPSIPVRAEVLFEENKEVLKIDIPMVRSITATTDGKVLRRRLKADGTPENIPMYPYEINTRLSELSLLDFSAQVVESSSVGDLDPLERKRLRDIIRLRKGDSSLLELSDEELDKALRFVKEENGNLKPTITGLLLIGKQDSLAKLVPTAKASFQVLEGANVRVNEDFSAPLLACFAQIEEMIKPWNPEREIEQGLFRVPIPEFSNAAIREGLVNAFVHRDYTILQKVRVLIEDDGLTISSPGGFIEGVDLNNLLTVEPHGRNQALADALKRIGLSERTGRGIDRIFEGSIIYGRPWPDYSESTPTYVKLLIPRALPDIGFVKMLSNEENRLGRSLPINSLLILSKLRQGASFGLKNLSEAIHISESRLKANLDRLIETGLVNGVGSGADRKFMLSSGVYKTQSNSFGYVRQLGVEYKSNEARVKELAEKQGGFITRDNVMSLLNINDSAAYRLLRKLVKENTLVLEGKGRASGYRLKLPK